MALDVDLAQYADKMTIKIIHINSDSGADVLLIKGTNEQNNSQKYKQKII